MELKTDYQKVVENLFKRIHTKTGHLGLITKLLEEIGNPHLSYPIIHIAGTNGKGQVSVKIARALENGGYKVGLFISPHILTLEERISINQIPIPRETIITYFHELETLHGSPSFFECLTWMGFRYFKEENVDVAVIEVGLGGILDATNVVQSELSVITSIGIDHVEYLGETLEEIAEEKGGIIKPGKPVVLGPKAEYSPILKRARELRAPVHLVKETSPLYEEENACIAKRSLELLSKQFPLSEEAIEKGIRENLPCRFEKRGNIIYDVAHNSAAFARLRQALEHTYPHQTFHFVIGMNRHKDIQKSLIEIEPLARHIHFVRCDHRDSATPKELGRLLETFSPCPFSIEETVRAGVKHAKAATNKDEMLVVCGSFYIMAQALSLEDMDN